MDPQKIIRHISFYDRKPACKPKMFTGDQMTSRQFGGWKQVTTAVKMVSSHARITGAVARQTGLRAVQIKSNGLAIKLG